MVDKAVVDTQGPNIDSTLNEQRKFDPPAEFSRQAHIQTLAQYEQLYKESIDSPDTFWSNVARELHWFKKWDKVLEWNCPWAKWFVGGQINLSYNCLDRHVETWRKNKAAIIWESEPGEVRVLTSSNCIAKCRSSPMC
jgi:acetyl-CoA synthetase